MGGYSKHSTKEATAGYLFFLNTIFSILKSVFLDASITDLKYNGALCAVRLWLLESSFSDSFESETLSADHQKTLGYRRTYLESNFRRIYRNSGGLSYRGS